MVNKNLKVHVYPDFYIADGSVVQLNLGVNPSLKITAMTEYAINSIPYWDGCWIIDISKQLKLLEEEWKMKSYK